MTATAATKTTAKPAVKTTATVAKTTTKPAAKVTTPAPKPAAATTTTSTASKPQPPAKVVTFIETLTTPEERRFATKQWRHAAGHRASTPSLRGVAQERAQVIREAIAALTR